MGFLPPLFARVDMARGAPTVAILFVTGCTIIGLSLGRQFVSAIVNMSAICMSITFVVCILCLLRQRKRQQASSSLEVPGGRPTILLALCGASVMACVAFFDPLLGAGGHIPLQWWLLLLWAALGVVSWTVSRRMAAVRIT
jgi:amino acid transporter